MLLSTKKTDTVRVNEIFYSVQGEGRFTGRPAVFLRLSGCNQRCSFCDTQHEQHTEMTEEQIVAEVSRYAARHIVITGGEPTLQLTPSLTNRLHDAGFFIQIETNGSCPLAVGCQIDWITCSPKAAPIVLQRIDELKVVYWGQDISQWESFPASDHRLQPLDTKDDARNAEILSETLSYILAHPLWTLSLQTHKMINVQ